MFRACVACRGLNFQPRESELVAACHHLHLPFTSWCLRRVFLCLPKSEPPRWLRGAVGCGKRVGSWAHRWQMRRLDITKQNIKVLCCRNFKVNDAARSLQVTLAQGPIPVASCVFPDRRKVSGLKKPIL